MTTKADLEELELVYLVPDEVKPYPDNPRVHPKAQLKMIEASIAAFSFNNPILVTPDHVLIAGHGRLEAAKKLKIERIPALVLAHLSEAEQRAYRIADNAIVLKGEWSVELLSRELEFVTQVDFDIAPGALGFETGEIDFHIDAAPSKSASSSDSDRVEEPDRTATPVSRLGDIWSIGRHVVTCGDAQDPASYRRVLGDRKADVVISDMPWNVPYAGHIGGLGKVQHDEFVMASGEMSRDEFRSFMKTVLTRQAEASHPGALNMQFIDWRSVADMIVAGEAIYDALINVCVWVKPNGGMGSLWRSRHELVCVFRNKGGKHRNNVMLGKHGRNRTNVWEYAGANSFSSDRMENLAAHATCKPVEMIAEAIKDCTDRKGVVLDAFLGSGTTVMAAHKAGRVGCGIELDPHYVDVSIQRIARVVGAEPKLADNRTFEQVRDARRDEEPALIVSEEETSDA
jgi:DNA modification methylase